MLGRSGGRGQVLGNPADEEGNMQKTAVMHHQVRRTERARVFAWLIVALTALSLLAASTASAQTTVGAKWQDIPNLGVTGSHTYIYTPSVMFDPAPMLTPVLFVYSNAGYASQDASWTALTNAGLIARPETDHASLIVQNPLHSG